MLIDDTKFNLMHKHISRPSIFNCHRGIRNTVTTLLQTLKQSQMMIPR